MYEAGDGTARAGSDAASGTGRPNRRQFIKAIGGGTAVTLAGCTGGGDGGGGEETPTATATRTATAPSTTQSSGDELADELQFYSWGGSTQEALTKHVIEPFQAEYGVSVKQSSFPSQDKMIANVRSSAPGSFDIVMPSLTGFYTAVQQDLLEPLRIENIETWDNLMPVFKNYNATVLGEAGTTYAAPVYYGTVGMVYNSDHVSGSPPFSWQKTWNQDFADRITLEGFAFLRVFTTALALGMDPNKIEGDDGSYETGIKQVYDAMAEQHELVVKYWTSGQEQTTLYSNETAYLGDGWSGRILSLREDGHTNLHYTVPDEGAFGWGDSFAIARGSERRFTAEKFIEFTYRPDVMKNLSPQIGYPPATGVASEKVTALPDYDPSKGEQLVFQNQKFKNEHQEEWSNTFEKIKLGEY